MVSMSAVRRGQISVADISGISAKRDQRVYCTPNGVVGLCRTNSAWIKLGDPHTHDFQGANRVYIRSMKADSVKRFCALQILCKGTNEHGQPRIANIFRGQGKSISKEEAEQWSKQVLAYFQAKAWDDLESTMKFVGDRWKFRTLRD